MPSTSFYCLKTKTKKILPITSIQSVSTKRGMRFFAKSTCAGVGASRTLSRNDYERYRSLNIPVINGSNMRRKLLALSTQPIPAPRTTSSFYKKKSIKELKALLKSKGIKGYSKLKKAELIQKLVTYNHK